MDVSLGSLRRRLLAMRAWDSQGPSLDKKINSAVNQALDRLAGDIPEALTPDEEHVTLHRSYTTGDTKAYVRVCSTDKRLLEFIDADGKPIDHIKTLATWRPNCTGEWDGIMHIEVKDPRGRWHRRQCREFFYRDPEASRHLKRVTGEGGTLKVVPSTSFVPLSLEVAKFNRANKQPGATVVAAGVGFASAPYANQAIGSQRAGGQNQTDAALKNQLSESLGKLPGDVTDEMLQNYKKARGQRRLRVVARGTNHVLIPAAYKRDDFGASRQSYDGVNGVEDGQGLVQGDPNFNERGTFFAGLPTGTEGATTILVPIDEGDPVESSTKKPLLPYKPYMVTLDRPWLNNKDGTTAVSITRTGVRKVVQSDPMEFRIYQPEFFLRDDVMELNEPAVIYDETEQQVWAIDTAGSDRAGMRDFQGETAGRPVRLWRGRHFQLPAPTDAPLLTYVKGGQRDSLDTGPAASEQRWSHATGSLKRGGFKICYTYVWGRRDKEWQQAPNVGFFGHDEITPDQTLWWAHSTSMGDIVSSERSGQTGISDPTWESAPSPVGHVVIEPQAGDSTSGAMLIRAPNIDALMGFSDPNSLRFSRTGIRLRFYVSYTGYADHAVGALQNVETNNRFYLLCETEPTFDQLVDDPNQACRFYWNGNQLYDIERQLRHSTGYFAYKTYPTHDQRYELDLRVTRLPKELVDDQDTPPIQRDAISALIELSAYYVALLDGADQGGAQIHLDRYTELARRYRARYANPGKVVEPTSIIGGLTRTRFNRFGDFSS